MSETIRCFVAIELPEELKNQIDRYLADLQPLAPKVKWVKARAMHITLKFLGNQTPAMVDAITESLMTGLPPTPDFRLTIAGFGAFPSERRPRVFWLGVRSEPREPLYALQAGIEERLELMGIEREQRRFSPHLTLGRVKFPQDFSQIFNFARQVPFQDFTFPVRKFVLMQSVLKPQGAEYHPLHVFSLKTEA